MKLDEMTPKDAVKILFYSALCAMLFGTLCKMAFNLLTEGRI